MGLIRHAGFSVCLYRAIGRDGGREKGESFSREQRTSHMVGWRAGAIIVLACNVRSVGGQEPVSFFVSERACLVETSVRRVMSMTLLRCSCCTHKSSPGTQHVRATGIYVRARLSHTINRPSTGQPGVSSNTCVPAQVFVHLYVTCLRESTRWIYRELYGGQRILPPIVISFYLIRCSRSLAAHRGQKSNISIPFVMKQLDGLWSFHRN